tara:strand:+ start:142 stop:1782 length:1641 start_codon:yes stop_codon:yes gene_type:complete
MGLFAQDSGELETIKYQRKSIASIDRVVILSDEYKLLDSQSVKAIWDSYISLSRFDKNRLPNSLSQVFLDALAVSSNVTVESLGEIVNSVYASEIQKLLTDPELQKARIEQFKEKNTYTFEFGKGKSYSVTASDLEALFSSAFFYIPYIRDVRFSKSYYVKKVDDKKKKMKEISLGIDAGIIWYQIKILPNKAVKVDYVETLTSTTFDSQAKAISYSDDTIINDLISGSLTTLGTNFSYKIKNMAVFNIKGRIDSVNKNSLYLELSEKEGVAVDDYFWIMEDYESEDGYKSKKVGLSYVSDFVADQGKVTVSKATQIFGNNHHVGSWVKESPRYGAALKINLGYLNNFQLDAKDGVVSEGSFYTNTVSSGIGTDISLSYLLSKVFKRSSASQLYLDFNFGFLPVSIDYGSLITKHDYPATFIGAVNAGVRKIFWINQVAYQPFIYIGGNRFQIANQGLLSMISDDEEGDVVFELNQAVLKYGIIFEKMISSYILLNVSLYRTLGLGDVSKSYVINQNLFSELEYSETASFSSLDWHGASFGLRFFY